MTPSTLLIAAASLTLMALPSTAAADSAVVTWDQAAAGAHGSGCAAGNVDFIAAGNEITIIFSDLGVTLDGGGAKAANKECNIIIPVELPAADSGGGWHVRALSESLLYGYVRAGGADGSITYSSRLFGLSTGKLSATVPADGQDPVDEPFLELAATTELPQHGNSCNHGHQHGNWMSQIKLAARRQDKADGITIAVSGQDVRVTLTALLERDSCAR